MITKRAKHIGASIGLLASTSAFAAEPVLTLRQMTTQVPPRVMDAQATEDSPRLLMQYQMSKRGYYAYLPSIIATAIDEDADNQALGQFTSVIPTVLEMGGLSNPLLAAAGGGLASYVSDFNNQMRNRFLDLAREELKQELEGMGRRERRRLLEMDPDAAVGSIFGSNPLSGMNAADFPAEAQALVTDARINAIREELHGEMVLNRSAHESARRSIVEVRRDLRATAMAVNEINNNMLERTRALGVVTERLSQEVNGLGLEMSQLSSRVDRNSEQIDFVQSVVWRNMSADERLVALDRGYGVSTLSAEEKERLRKSLRIESAVDHFRADSAQVLRGMHAFQSVLERIPGVPADLVRAASQVQRVATVGTSAISSFMRGDVLGGVMSVLGLFGGGVDAATARHQQIMREFERLHRELDVLEAKVDNVLRLQIVTLNKLQEIQGRIDAYHQVVLQRFAVTHDILVQGAQQELNACLTMFDGLKEYLNGRAPRSFSLANQNDYLSFVAGENADLDSLKKCFDGIRYHVTDIARAEDPVSQAIFGVKPQDNEAAIAVHRQLNAFVQDAANHSGRDESEAKLSFFRAATWYSGDVTELDAKVAAVSAQSGAQSPLLRYMPKLISARAVMRYLSLLPDFSYFIDHSVLNGSVQVCQNISERCPGSRRFGRATLDAALKIADAAIAQQSLLAGDALLPELWKVLSGNASGDLSARRRIAFELIQGNEQLRINLGRYALSKMRRSGNRGMPSLYAAALAASGISGLASLFPNRPNGFSFARSGDAAVISVNLGENLQAQLPVMTAEEYALDYMRSGQSFGLSSNQVIDDLMALKNTLVETLAGYDFPASLSPTDRGRLTSLVAYGSASRQ